LKSILKSVFIIAIIVVIGIVSTIIVIDQIQYQALQEKYAFCIDMFYSIKAPVWPNGNPNFDEEMAEYKYCKYDYEKMRLDYWDLRYTPSLLEYTK